MRASRLPELGGTVELIEPTKADTVRLSDTPDKLGRMVKATFTGSGTKKILLTCNPIQAKPATSESKADVEIYDKCI